MNTRVVIIALVAISFFPTPPARVDAKDARDGSRPERAILVQGDYEHSVDWEWDYLKKRLSGRGMPKDQALMELNGRWYDKFVFATPDGDKVIYFDLTRFADRITRKHSSK